MVVSASAINCPSLAGVYQPLPVISHSTCCDILKASRILSSPPLRIPLRSAFSMLCRSAVRASSTRSSALAAELLTLTPRQRGFASSVAWKDLAKLREKRPDDVVITVRHSGPLHYRMPMLTCSAACSTQSGQP